MAGFDTKADFDASYKFRVERYLGGAPNTRPEVVVHYHRWGMKPILVSMWEKLQPVLNIAPTDNVLVVGAGFGWGVEAVQAATGVTNIVGIDISSYIQSELGNTEEAELREQIISVGLDPDTGRGLEIMNFVYDGQPRANVIVLNNDASTGPQRNEIRQALGGNWPSVVIYEDMFDDSWTDTELVQARDAGNGFGGSQRLIAVYRPTASRSAQALKDLMPSSPSFEVITPDGAYIP